jgi:hypothetical protein
VCAAWVALAPDSGAAPLEDTPSVVPGCAGVHAAGDRMGRYV